MKGPLRLVLSAAVPAAESSAVTWGDGRCRNPLVKADYFAPDAIRVDNDFYLVASGAGADGKFM